MTSDPATTMTLFLAGDVMTGRGIDQVLPEPSDPRLFEGYLSSALGYVELAETANGPIRRPVDFAYVWGDALADLRRLGPDARIVNLETSITRSDDHEPKGINYRMHPANVPCLGAAEIDCCVLANNHVFDWGEAGLIETLATLDQADIGHAGAGRSDAEAAAPMIKRIAGRRLLVYAFGCRSSGIPRDWTAGPAKPGVHLLPDLSEATVTRIAAQVAAAKRPGDIAVASIHWGPNWGYEVPVDQRRFAHGLIRHAGIDMVHGHSAHHAKAVEVYEGKLILYGCGDFLNDYEGIRGYERFRDDLALMYLATLDLPSGRLAQLAIVPYRIRNFRLNRAPRADMLWLRDVLSREGGRFSTWLSAAPEGTLILGWRA
jgi:poly-gamma-glutamate synthesis protein (capsule biosynthesis protein)